MTFTALLFTLVAMLGGSFAFAHIDRPRVLDFQFKLTTVTDFAAAEQIMPFEKIDKDQDGQISREEAKVSAWLLSKFEELDIDRDGSVSRFEYQSGIANQSPMTIN